MLEMISGMLFFVDCMYCFCAKIILLQKNLLLEYFHHVEAIDTELIEFYLLFFVEKIYIWIIKIFRY